MAKQATIKLVTSTVGDLIWLSNDMKLAELLLHAESHFDGIEGPSFSCVVRPLVHQGDNVFASSGRRAIVPLGDVVAGATYKKGAGQYRVIVPPLV